MSSADESYRCTGSLTHLLGHPRQSDVLAQPVRMVLKHLNKFRVSSFKFCERAVYIVWQPYVTRRTARVNEWTLDNLSSVIQTKRAKPKMNEDFLKFLI